MLVLQVNLQPDSWLFNCLIFAIMSLTITFISLILPSTLYYYDRWLYRLRKWERNGRVYQDWLKIRSWKDKVPELSDFLPFIYPKKEMPAFDESTFALYLRESCKAEFAHWCIILSTGLFFLWSSVTITTAMFLIASVLNLPFIIIQRYNRPRIILLMKRKLKLMEREAKPISNRGD